MCSHHLPPLSGAFGVWDLVSDHDGKNSPRCFLQRFCSACFFVKLVKSSVERKAVWKNSSPSLSSVASGLMRSFSPHNTDYFLTSSNAQARYYYYSSSSFCPGLPLAFNRLLLLLLRVGVEYSKKNPKVLSVLSDPSCLCFSVNVFVTARSLISTGG